VKPPAPRGQALVVGAVLILVALVPLTWGLTGVVFGVGLPFSGPVLMAVRVGLLLMGLVGLAIGVRLVQDSLPDER
jgi:hypothetical protein